MDSTNDGKQVSSKASNRHGACNKYLINMSLSVIGICIILNIIKVVDLQVATYKDFSERQESHKPHQKPDIFQLEANHKKSKDEGNLLLSESTVFQNVIDRAVTSRELCASLPTESIQANNDYLKRTEKYTNASLPEFGVIEDITDWLAMSTGSRVQGESTSVIWGHESVCRLPPKKLCDVEGFTVVFMSHSLDRIQTLAKGINKVASWKSTHEIVLVWNSDPEILDRNHAIAKLLNDYHDNPEHPLRIFFSLKHGLKNNLFNRYHPKIAPKMEAILYFDDDGPFFQEDAMVSGFELWKRDSGRQVGCFARNIRFKSKRMLEQGEIEQEKSIKEVNMARNRELGNEDIPHFIPVCQSDAGDKLEYNFFTFNQFNAHMLLPSGSFIHRNFLCWLWHPAFSKVRKFILDHPTHPGESFGNTLFYANAVQRFIFVLLSFNTSPTSKILPTVDDMTVSALISHLTGKAPRLFSRKIKRSSRRLDDYPFSSSNGRKLLWQQQDWAAMREQAIGNILGYFGSINPGSVGWCTGTTYQKFKRREKNHVCDPEFPVESQVPWMNVGALGYDIC